MAGKLTRADLMSLEEYARERSSMRARVMAHKAARRAHLGEVVTLVFEDRLTMLYQVQEMLRAERIFEEQGIEDELEAYNPLIPDGSNWKATLLIEFPDPEERRTALRRLVGLEDSIWVRVEGHEPVYAIADEDLEREADGKTSSVHFLRFELDPRMIASLRGGSALAIGSDHSEYRERIDPVTDPLRSALIEMLD